MLFYFLQAIIIGIGVCAIVGPISLLFIRKTLENGISSSIAIGLGTALADCTFGAIAALGLSTISHFLQNYSSQIQFVGGISLFYMAYNDIRKKTVTRSANIKTSDNVKLGIKVFFLTLANPITIASFIGIFASIGGSELTMIQSLIIALGCLIGSVIWWIILGSILLKTKHKVSEKMLHKIRISSNILIGCFGLIAILKSIF